MNPAGRTASFWQRRVVGPIIAQLTQGVTADRIALTLALGLVCGLFPFLGLTTALCFVVAFGLGLNQPLIQVVNQLLWPAQLALIPVYVRTGSRLLGIAAPPIDPAEIARVFLASQREFWSRFGLAGLSALTAWLLSAPALFAAAYGLLRPFIRRLASAAAVRT